MAAAVVGMSVLTAVAIIAAAAGPHDTTVTQRERREVGAFLQGRYSTDLAVPMPIAIDSSETMEETKGFGRSRNRKPCSVEMGCNQYRANMSEGDPSPERIRLKGTQNAFLSAREAETSSASPPAIGLIRLDHFG